MSVYSGFATRKDQTNYNQLLAKLLRTLIAHLLELDTPARISKTKSMVYSKLITKIQQYDQHKYLQPKFSEVLQPLARLVGLADTVENLERTGSKWATPSNEERNRTPSSSSRNQFRSRKVSQGANPVQKAQEHVKRQKQQSLNNNQISGRTVEQQMVKTPQRKNSKYMSFYASQSQQHQKISKNYNKKYQELQILKQRGAKFGTKFNRFKTMPSADDRIQGEGDRRTHNCLDLKTVKEAQSYLEDCQRQDRVYRITQNITFTQI